MMQYSVRVSLDSNPVLPEAYRRKVEGELLRALSLGTNLVPCEVCLRRLSGREGEYDAYIRTGNGTVHLARRLHGAVESVCGMVNPRRSHILWRILMTTDEQRD